MDLRSYLSTFVAQSVNPIYNALGRNVGYFASDADLAAGQVYTYDGETLGPPEQWRVKNLFGVLTDAGSYLVDKGLKPFWLDADAAQAIYDSQHQPLLPNIDLGDLFSSAGNQLAPGVSASGEIVKWGAIGGLGLAGFLLIMRAAGPRRRGRR